MNRENEPLWHLVKKIDNYLDYPRKEYGYDNTMKAYYAEADDERYSAQLIFKPQESGNVDVSMIFYTQKGHEDYHWNNIDPVFLKISKAAGWAKKVDDKFIQAKEEDTNS